MKSHVRVVVIGGGVVGFVPVDPIDDGAQFTVEILGERRAARLVREPAPDPRGERMRG